MNGSLPSLPGGGEIRHGRKLLRAVTGAWAGPMSEALESSLMPPGHCVPTLADGSGLTQSGKAGASGLEDSESSKSPTSALSPQGCHGKRDMDWDNLWS